MVVHRHSARCSVASCKAGGAVVVTWLAAAVRWGLPYFSIFSTHSAYEKTQPLQDSVLKEGVLLTLQLLVLPSSSKLKFDALLALSMS